MGRLFFGATFLMATLLISCNTQESLISSGAENPELPITKSFVNTVSVFWGTQDPSNAELKLAGDKNHVLDRSKFNRTVLTLGGVVKTSPITRDIVFVVDVSGSMGTHNVNNSTLPGSDPLINGSCNRLNAVRAAINSTKAQGPSRFSLITFNRNKVRSSGGFFSSLEQMFPSENLANILCAALDGTNYTNALNEAISLLELSPPTHLREVYFLTDGEPMDIFPGTNNHCNYQHPFCNGRAQAITLRETMDATLGTLMLGNNSAGNLYLQNNIAGLDAHNSPLHVQAANSLDLINSLFSLSRDNLVRGTISVRAKNTQAWSEFDMLLISLNGQFKTEGFAFDSALYPEGIEMSVEYETERGHCHTGFASITWGSSFSMQTQ